jgi:hypothetical protein
MTVEVGPALTVSSLLLNRALQIGVLLQVGGVVALLTGKEGPTAGYGAVIASAASLGLGIIVLLAASPLPARVWPLILALSTGATSTGLLLWLARNLILHRGGRLLIGLTALTLPVAQFWYSSSWLPSKLNSSIGVEVSPIAPSSIKGFKRGVLQVKIVNSGDVGAVILGAELVLCHRQSNRGLNWDVETLYDDSDCQTSQLLKEGTSVDPRSTWTLRSVYMAPVRDPLLQVHVKVWYARSDRIKFPNQPENSSIEPIFDCTRRNVDSARLLPDSRARSLVERPRFLTFEGADNGARYFYISSDGDRRCFFDDRLADQLGFGWVQVQQTDWAPGASQ